MKISSRSLEASWQRRTGCTAEKVQGRKKYHCAVIGLIPLLSMLLVCNAPFQWNRQGVLVMGFSSAVSLYMQTELDSLMHKKYAETITAVCYLASLCLLFLVRRPDVFSFWMLGGLLIAMFVDSKLGLLVHVVLTFLMGIALSRGPETVIPFLMIGGLMTLLTCYLVQKATVIYACFILLSANITLNFLVHSYLVNKGGNCNYLSSMLSLLAVLVSACFFYFFYQFLSRDKNMIEQISDFSEEEPFEEFWSKVVQERHNNGLLHIAEAEDGLGALNTGTFAKSGALYDDGAKTSYELLVEADNELLRQLKEYSLPLYRHAVLIADISGRAAKVLGADEMLTKAGGLYHEIGKIKGSNYMAEGLKIAEEYGFPGALKVVMRQHNIRYEKPTSVEAAIVMLTDHVVSTIAYIEKKKEHSFILANMINHILLTRLDKGDLDASGLSVRDFKELRAFYQKEFGIYENIGRKVGKYDPQY